MFRMPGKEGTAAEKDAEKKKSRKQIWRSVQTFVGWIVLLRTGITVTFLIIMSRGRPNILISESGGPATAGTGNRFVENPARSRILAQPSVVESQHRILCIKILHKIL